MKPGDPVAVFDLRAARWCRGEVVCVNEARGRATVAASRWWAVLPITPQWMRPIAVVRAA